MSHDDKPAHRTSAPADRPSGPAATGSRAVPDRRAPPDDPAKGESGAAAKPSFGPDEIVALSRNIGRAVEEAGHAMAADLRPREDGRVRAEMSDEVADAVKAIGFLAEYWLKDPQRAIKAQSILITDFMSLWAATLKRMAGEDAGPVAEPDPRDPRFKDPQWRSNYV